MLTQLNKTADSNNNNNKQQQQLLQQQQTTTTTNNINHSFYGHSLAGTSS